MKFTSVQNCIKTKHNLKFLWKREKFLKVYYVIKLSSLFTAIRTKLIGTHGGLESVINIYAAGFFIFWGKLVYLQCRPENCWFSAIVM